jgi:hypothetical protein
MKKGNIPIPDLQENEEVWLIVTVTSARKKTTQRGQPYLDCLAHNPTGSLTLKIWSEALQTHGEIQPGLWGIVGALNVYNDQPQFVVTEYRPVDAEKYHQELGEAPIIPQAYTIDIETIALPDFRDRIRRKLRRNLELGNMGIEQIERYLEDPDKEAERCYLLGSLAATSGRVLSIAAHVGPKAEFCTDDGSPADSGQEYAFGIDADGNEEGEAKALNGFIALMSAFEGQADEIVGHNVTGFDLPFIYQRCLVNGINTRPVVDLGGYNVPGVFDTMRRWCFGDRGRVSLDDLAWALGIESSKTAEADGSKVYELHAAGLLSEIREYNLRDVRVTRQVYERMIRVVGR